MRRACASEGVCRCVRWVSFYDGDEMTSGLFICGQTDHGDRSNTFKSTYHEIGGIGPRMLTSTLKASRREQRQTIRTGNANGSSGAPTAANV